MLKGLNTSYVCHFLYSILQIVTPLISWIPAKVTFWTLILGMPTIWCIKFTYFGAEQIVYWLRHTSWILFSMDTYCMHNVWSMEMSRLMLWCYIQLTGNWRRLLITGLIAVLWFTMTLDVSSKTFKSCRTYTLKFAGV